MDVLIGLVLLFIIIAIVVSVISIFVGLLVYSFWFRLFLGGGLIWLIWANATLAFETSAWIGTILIGLGVLSPWLLVFAVASFVVGFLLTRSR